MKLPLPDLTHSVCPECRPVVEALQKIIELQAQEIVTLKNRVEVMEDEIRELKKLSKKPKFKPSGMEKGTEPADDKDDDNDDKTDSDKKCSSKPRGKRSKTATMTIHDEQVVQPVDPLPEGARLKGYREFVVQDMKITSFNTRYRLAYYLLPDGSTLTGKLPKALNGQHFGNELRSYVLYQYHHCQVTQPLLCEQLRDWGVDISSGQLNRLLQQGHEAFHQEKDELLNKGLASTGYITTDDTGGRHLGNNGYVTHIGNEFFAWFQSSDSKSRINFLSILCGQQQGYRVNTSALDSMKEYKLPELEREQLANHPCQFFESKERWDEHLKQLNITRKHHVRAATEGALLAQAIEVHTIESLVVVSDGAGQFKVLTHALCWVHAERLIYKLVPLNEKHREDIKKVRGEIWNLYRDLKRYKIQPHSSKKVMLEKEFERIFTQKTNYELLNQQLKRLHKHKSSLLRVLEWPEIPLHTNGSENDLREQVKRRKISGGTRSDLGRQCRDTFSSLKKTCRKLNISFWQYLQDRLSMNNQIPSLGELVLEKSRAATDY